MASLQKIGKAYRLWYYHNGKKCSKYFPKNTPLSVVKAEQKKIESELAMSKAGLKRFGEQPAGLGNISIQEMADQVFKRRENEISIDTMNRNKYAMKTFFAIVGPEMLIKDLTNKHLEQYKRARFAIGVENYKANGWELNENKIKLGINKDLSNIRTVFRAAEKLGIISSDYLPKIDFYQVDRQRLPQILDESELNLIEKELNGEYKLAFQVIRFTGARRSEIARKSLSDNDTRGLRWKDINWLRGTIRFYSKKAEKLVPMHEKLRRILLDRKAELGASFDIENHVVSCVRDSLTGAFKDAMKRAGVDRPGSVHLIRHSAATMLLQAGASLEAVREILGHTKITTTQIYLHLQTDDLRKAINQAFD